MTRMVGTIKRAALDAVEAAAPSGVYYGTVVSAAPLQIRTEQKLTLGAGQLVLARSVTDYPIVMEVDHETEDETCDTKHRHGYRGEKVFLVKAALEAGEKVLLVREQGGQKYIVIDRVVVA